MSSMEVPSERPSSLSVVGLVQAGLVLGGVATALGFAGRWSWLFDLAAHFRVQAMVGAMALALWAWALKRRRWAGFGVLLALVHGATVLPLFLPVAAETGRGEGRGTFLTFNVHTANTNHAGVLAAIQASRADVVALQEVNGAWMNALEPLRAEWPFLVAEPQEDNFGICLFSKWPIESSQVHRWGAAEVPTLEARLKAPAGSVTVVATHPVPPVGRSASAARDEQLALLAQRVREIPGHVVVMGDLNTTPWGASFRRLLADSGLRDSARGHGWQPTWPSFQPLLFIPLDHVLVTPQVQVLSRRVGEAAGSDHRPVVVELAW